MAGSAASSIGRLRQSSCQAPSTRGSRPPCHFKAANNLAAATRAKAGARRRLIPSIPASQASQASGYRGAAGEAGEEAWSPRGLAAWGPEGLAICGLVSLWAWWPRGWLSWLVQVVQAWRSGGQTAWRYRPVGGLGAWQPGVCRDWPACKLGGLVLGNPGRLGACSWRPAAAGAGRSSRSQLQLRLGVLGLGDLAVCEKFKRPSVGCHFAMCHNCDEHPAGSWPSLVLGMCHVISFCEYVCFCCFTACADLSIALAACAKR